MHLRSRRDARHHISISTRHTHHTSSRHIRRDTLHLDTHLDTSYDIYVREYVCVRYRHIRGAHSPPYVQEYVLHPAHPFPDHLDVLLFIISYPLKLYLRSYSLIEAISYYP